MDSGFIDHLQNLMTGGNVGVEAERIQREQLSSNMVWFVMYIFLFVLFLICSWKTKIEYLKLCASAIVTQSVSDSLRHLSGIIIKNSLGDSKDAWLQSSSSDRSQIKKLVCSIYFLIIW